MEVENEKLEDARTLAAYWLMADPNERLKMWQSDLKKICESLLAVTEEKPESGWVIEKLNHSETIYWAGRGMEGSFERDVNQAIRFSRAEDAALVLSWLFKGEGRVAEHVWLPKA
jgi:hypothetical protein